MTRSPDAPAETSADAPERTSPASIERGRPSYSWRYGQDRRLEMVRGFVDLEGARIIAERLRTEVSKLAFTSEVGGFSCTISMGLSHWPGDAGHKQELIELTDQALYFSKRNGRNKVTAHADIAEEALQAG